MKYPPELAEDNKNLRPLDLDGREIALRGPRLGNPAAPHQYTNSKSESEDTLSESDGYYGGRLANLPSEEYKSFGDAMDAIRAEYEQIRIKNMVEAEDMEEKQRTTVGESGEVYNLHTAELLNCYKKARSVLDESTKRRAVIGAELKCMLNRIYGGEEISQEETVHFLERMLEIGTRPVSIPSMAGH